MPAVDPITFEVVRNALVAATDEMVLALKRSAYSTNIKTRSDFSCAFFDARLRGPFTAWTFRTRPCERARRLGDAAAAAVSDTRPSRRRKRPQTDS